MSSIRKTLTVALVLAAVAFLVSLIYIELPYERPTPSSQNEVAQTAAASSTIALKGVIIKVEIADTSEERTRGLSGNAGLAEDEGMLFVFNEDAPHTFWMKDMRFAIDIIWISRDGAVVHVEENVAPESYPAVFAPRNEARYVVELPAGWSQRHDVSIGDRVTL